MAVAPKNIAIGSLITSVLLAALLYVNGSAQQCPVTAAAYEELLGQLAQSAGELGEARAELASLRSTTSATLAKVSTHSSDRAVTTSPPKRQGCEFLPGFTLQSGSRRMVVADTKEACCTSCQEDSECAAAVFAGKTCWLKAAQELSAGFIRTSKPALTCITAKAPNKDIMPRTECRQASCFTTEYISTCKIANMIETSFVKRSLGKYLITKSNSHSGLWLRGAGLMPGLALELMEHYKGAPVSEARILRGVEATIEAFPSSKEEIAKQKQVFNNQHSDKARSNHAYHTFYAHIFKTLIALGQGPIKTLEIGIGTNNSALISTMGPGGTPGASNRAFRELLPSDSLIYAADVDKDILYQEERIKTTWVDQLDRKALNEMLVSLGENTLDLIIDDGLHLLAPNLNVLIFALKHIRKGGWVVIEDIERRDVSFWTTYVDVIMRTNPAYRTAMVTAKGQSYCYLIQKVE